MSIQPCTGPGCVMCPPPLTMAQVTAQLRDEGYTAAGAAEGIAWMNSEALWDLGMTEDPDDQPATWDDVARILDTFGRNSE